MSFRGLRYHPRPLEENEGGIPTSLREWAWHLSSLKRVDVEVHSTQLTVCSTEYVVYSMWDIIYGVSYIVYSV